VRSLQARLLLTYLTVAGLVLILLAGSLAVFLAANPIAVGQAYRRLDVVAGVLAQRETRPALGQGAGRLRQLLGRLDLAAGRMILLQSDGLVLVDSDPSQPPFPADRLAGSDGNGQFTAGSVAYLYSKTTLEDGRVLVLIVPRPGIRLATLLGEDLGRPFVRAGLVALGVSILLAWLIARWVARPLKVLSGAARAVAEGDYTAPPDVHGPSEIEALAASFREMVDRVRAGQQSQRDFVANVSHELKTPLTSIQGFAQAIEDGAAGDAGGVLRAARVIHEESDRLRRLVDNLLDLARLDAGQISLAREAVDLNLVIAGVLERLSLEAAQGEVRLRSDLPALPAVIGDGDRLAQVFTNLVDNAIRHSPAGEAVVVRGRLEPGWVVVSVDDSGPGIPEAELSRIFERFYRVDKARPGGEGHGTGLGLAISREIVDAHGGGLTAQSEPGKGSRFLVRLPTPAPDDATPVRRRSRL
jgi:signal transduction histidine kinase